MNKKEWNEKFQHKVLIPTLIVSGIIMLLPIIIALIMKKYELIALSFVLPLFPIIIGLGFGGLDFRNEYGYYEDCD